MPGAYQKAEPEKGGESRSSIRAHRTLLVASPIRIDRVAQLTFTSRTCFRERPKAQGNCIAKFSVLRAHNSCVQIGRTRIAEALRCLSAESCFALVWDAAREDLGGLDRAFRQRHPS